MGLIAIIFAMALDPIRILLVVLLAFVASNYTKAALFGAASGLVIVALLMARRYTSVTPIEIALHVLVSAVMAIAVFSIVKRFKKRREAN